MLFDEEFPAGKSLQGNCSPFRGALVAWSTVLSVSTNPFNNNNTSNSNQSSRKKGLHGNSNKNSPANSLTPSSSKSQGNFFFKKIFVSIKYIMN